MALAYGSASWDSSPPKRADSNRDSNVATHRANTAHNDSQDGGDLTGQPAGWPELIRKRSEGQVLAGLTRSDPSCPRPPARS
jgi:hypothetical protein